MTTKSTSANNRAFTLAGANKLFEKKGITFHKHELGYYHCVYKDKEWKDPKLTSLCQALLDEYMS